jgi:hypothetical protein
MARVGWTTKYSKFTKGEVGERVVGGWWQIGWGMKIVLVLVLVLVLDSHLVASLIGGFGFGLIAEGRQLVAGVRGAAATLNRQPRSPTSCISCISWLNKTANG